MSQNSTVIGLREYERQTQVVVQTTRCATRFQSARAASTMEGHRSEESTRA